MLLFGNIIMFAGFAFVSGAKEALLYESMLEIQQTENYDEVLGKVNSIAIATTVVSIFLGGWLFSIDPRLTFFAWLIFSLVAAIILFFMREPVVVVDTTNALSYLETLKSGVKAIFHKTFRPFVFAVLFWSMFIKSYEGVVRQSMGSYFGFTGETLGYVIAVVMIPALLVAFNYRKVKTFFTEKYLPFVIILLYVVAFLIALLANIYAGMATFLLIYVAQEIANPFVLGLINKHIDSKHRSTAISTVSLFSQIPYILIVIGFGQLLDPTRLPLMYVVFIGLLVLYFLTSTDLMRRKPSK